MVARGGQAQCLQRRGEEDLLVLAQNWPPEPFLFPLVREKWFYSCDSLFCACRPYDLVTVPKHLVNAQHYVFSPYGVLHVHPEEGTEALSLGKWHREAVLWQLMQSIPSFRLFLVRKAFIR